MTNPPPPPHLSREAFEQFLTDAGLIPAGDLRVALAAADSADAPAFADRLVAAGVLSRFQTNAVLAGRPGDLRIGNYDVLDKLGAGGMGTVFKARHRRMKRVVALKVLPQQLARDESFVLRFQREVETIAHLNHPNIVMAFDADEFEGGHFLVMEFVDGRDLAREVAADGPLAVADAVGVVRQAALGLGYAHERGVVHRDVKPHNLLRDRDGVVKVADLGLARLSGSSSVVGAGITAAGGVLGTADYIAPEQALDSTTIDHRADVYSLGCTLFFLLAGRPPYAAPTLMALLMKHQGAPVPSARQARGEVPPVLNDLVEGMLAKRPEDRIQSMADVVRVLDGLEGQVTDLTVRPGVGGLSDPSPGTNPASEGATMAFVPQARDGAVPTPSELRRVSDLAVVLVEPSRTQAGIVRKYLQEIGIALVYTTGSGAEAVKLARVNRAHAVISTLHAADMTGPQLAARLRTEPGCAAVGFILTTSAADAAEVTGLTGDPRAFVLAKPFDLKQLARCLAAATGRAPESLLPGAT